jgi:hypothetical protein
LMILAQYVASAQVETCAGLNGTLSARVAGTARLQSRCPVAQSEQSNAPFDGRLESAYQNECLRGRNTLADEKR